MEGFQKVVVIKRILSHLARDNEFVSMFLDEARIAAKLSHPNIAQIYDLGRATESFYIAMEYVPGRTCAALMSKCREAERRVPIEHTCRIIAEVADGLYYAHTQKDYDGRPLNIIHRDISPQNILVTFNGGIKLVDFGIAKASTQLAQTRAGVLKGKYAYMSPEQVRGDKLDPRSDIFAVGIVMYELLTGQQPFVRETSLKTLKAIVQEKPLNPREFNPDIAIEVVRILSRALEKNPDRRYGSAREMQQAIESYLDTAPQRSTPVRFSQFLYDLFDDELTSDGGTMIVKGLGEIIMPARGLVEKPPVEASEEIPEATVRAALKDISPEAEEASRGFAIITDERAAPRESTALRSEDNGYDDMPDTVLQPSPLPSGGSQRPVKPDAAAGTPQEGAVAGEAAPAPPAEAGDSDEKDKISDNAATEALSPEEVKDILSRVAAYRKSREAGEQAAPDPGAFSRQEVETLHEGAAPPRDSARVAKLALVSPGEQAAPQRTEDLEADRAPGAASLNSASIEEAAPRVGEDPFQEDAANTDPTNAPASEPAPHEPRAAAMPAPQEPPPQVSSIRPRAVGTAVSSSEDGPPGAWGASRSAEWNASSLSEARLRLVAAALLSVAALLVMVLVLLYFLWPTSQGSTETGGTGSIIVRTTPSGAEVWVNARKQAERTPAQYGGLPLGENSVRISLKGHALEQRVVRVGKDGPETLIVDLRKLE